MPVKFLFKPSKNAEKKYPARYCSLLFFNIRPDTPDMSAGYPTRYTVPVPYMTGGK